MKDPYFLLQKGDVMPLEKLACSFSDYPVRIASFEKLTDPSYEVDRTSAVPLGTVEYIAKFCERAQIELPSSLWYPDEVLPLFDRNVRVGQFKDALPEEFVKPSEKVKAFPASVKKDLSVEVNPSEKTLIQDVVPFESEFRFYLQDTITKFNIVGWARYDDLSVTNPEPDFDLVERIADVYHEILGPSAYSIDIGWRPDLQRYSLVEVNDAWALGYYQNQDKQSNPPTRQQYADMLVSRWRQILFCNIV
jgi:hypothetical protein